MEDDIAMLLDGENIKSVQTTDIYVPKGWSRFISVRTGGASAGKYDVSYYSPKGKKLRSKQELKNYIERHNMDVKIEEFVFASGINRRKKCLKTFNPPLQPHKKLKPNLDSKVDLYEENTRGSADLEDCENSAPSSSDESTDSFIEPLIDAGILPKKKHKTKRKVKKCFRDEEEEEFQSLGLVLERNQEQNNLNYHVNMMSKYTNVDNSAL